MLLIQTPDPEKPKIIRPESRDTKIGNPEIPKFVEIGPESMKIGIAWFCQDRKCMSRQFEIVFWV